jgi:copper resistance protein B
MNATRCLLTSLVLGLVLSVVALAQESETTFNAADEVYDPEAMQKARDALRHETGGQVIYFVMADRFEVQSNEGAERLVLDAQGWVGKDYQRFWVKTEGEYEGGKLEEAEIQGLYSRAVSTFFDFQAGIRQDVAAGSRRTFGVVGIQGLAPYWFEIDTALFVSQDGDVTARFEGEYDLFVTQRLIVQPRAELSFSFQKVEQRAIGSGLSTAEVGARIRYEIRREFAPYLGVSWAGATGRTADLWRRQGGNTNSLSIVAGVRFWH